jgi:hypothetical protein
MTSVQGEHRGYHDTTLYILDVHQKCKLLIYNGLVALTGIEMFMLGPYQSLFVLPD